MNEVNDAIIIENFYDADQLIKNFSYNDVHNSYHIELIRKVSAEEMNNMDVDIMPGLKVYWKFSSDIENCNNGQEVLEPKYTWKCDAGNWKRKSQTESVIAFSDQVFNNFDTENTDQVSNNFDTENTDKLFDSINTETTDQLLNSFDTEDTSIQKEFIRRDIEGYILMTAYWMGDNSLLCSHEATQTAQRNFILKSSCPFIQNMEPQVRSPAFFS